MMRRAIAWLLIAVLVSIANASYAAKEITAEKVIDAFIDADIDLLDWTIYDAENDPNYLLGRPGQYIGKATFWDSRIGDPERAPEAGTVEVFKSEKDLLNRMRYIERIGESMPALVQYQYRHKLVLLRLNKRFSPKSAAQFDEILRGIK